jgi:PAS domain S-box-containing protein
MTRRVLLVDISPSERERIAEALPDASLLEADVFDIGHAQVDAIICAWESSGRACCSMVRASGLRTPVIALVEQGDEESVVEAMRGGASDVLVRQRWHRLASIVARDADVISSGAAHMSELRFHSLWDSDIILITVVGADGCIVDANDAFSKVLGWTRSELRHMSWAKLTPSDWADADAAARTQLLREGAARPWEKELVARDGRRVPIVASAVLMPGKPPQALAFAIDLSEHKRVDRALRERVRLATATAEVALALTQAPSLDVMLQRSCDALQRTFRLCSVELRTVEHDALKLRAAAGVERDSAPLELALAEQGLERTSWPSRWKPFLVARDGWERCPLTIGGELVGLIRFVTDAPIDDAAREAIATIANASALGVQRALAEARKDRAEAELRQAQKLEAVGRLAGGVAHDFNNLLSVIIGYARLTRAQLDPDDELVSSIAEIEAAGERAKTLTAQLLAFSRRQVLQPRVLDLDRVIAGMHGILQRLLSEAIELVIERSDAAHRIFADPPQIEQVLINLVANARDAIAGSGTVTIATDLVIAADGRRQVRLAVSDTGAGMDQTTCSRIFEPFFTTKPQGAGTGLGLSTVFGIVKQSGGSIHVESEPGRGARFELMFPSAEGPLPKERPQLTAAVVGGSETILLCEDDRQVRAMCRDTLQRYGYRVLEAADPQEALRLGASRVDLLLTDVVMPRMSGRQLSERIRVLHPALPVLFMSGYTDDAVLREGVSQGVPFLQKPIQPEVLAGKVREVLDAAAAHAFVRPSL